MNKQQRIEIRAIGECRASETEEGIFEGYPVTWNFIDTYNSKFERGAFAASIEKKMPKGRIKVTDAHGRVIGRVIDAREDDKGLWIQGKLTLAVQQAREAWELLKDNVYKELSFGFRATKDRYEKGVRIISELEWYETALEPFPASERALVTSYRRYPMDTETETDTESRATDFSETLTDADLRRRGEQLMSALFMTLDEIWYGRQGGEPLAMIDQAISDFHGAYLEWATTFMERFRTDDNDRRALPEGERFNALAQAMREHMSATDLTAETLAAESALTVTEVRRLLAGQVIADRTKLSTLPEAVRTEHQRACNGAIETLCAELRSGLSAAERQRISALLGLGTPSVAEPEMAEADNIIDFLDQCQRRTFGGAST